MQLSDLFETGQFVRHKKGGLYYITETPSANKRLEYCDEPFYKYCPVITNYVLDLSTMWYRCKSEMEDGRFILEERVAL